VKIALYKSTRPGLSGLFNILTRWWIAGPYSHCELIFSDGMAASSSFLDKGVRFKQIDFDPARWDFITVDGDEAAARAWFEIHEGQGYDLLGLIGFMVRPITGQKHKWVCSEAVMAALGYEEAWRFDPCSMARAVCRPQIPAFPPIVG
jgi:hypothetical protein